MGNNKLAKFEPETENPRKENEVSDTVKITVGRNSGRLDAVEKRVEKLDGVMIQMNVLSRDVVDMRQEMVRTNDDINKSISSFKKEIKDSLGDIKGNLKEDIKNNKERFDGLKKILLWLIVVGITIVLAMPGTLIVGLNYTSTMNEKVQEQREKTDSLSNINRNMKDSMFISTIVSVQKSVDNINKKIDGLHIK